MATDLVCTRAGVHGKVWKEGDTATAEQLEALGGFVPDYFKPAGSPAAKEAEADADGNGKLTVAEMKNYLTAKGVQFPPNAKKADLEALMAEAAADSAADPLE